MPQPRSNFFSDIGPEGILLLLAVGGVLLFVAGFALVMATGGPTAGVTP